MLCEVEEVDISRVSFPAGECAACIRVVLMGKPLIIEFWTF